MVSLKEIEAWCLLQIDLLNRLYDLEDFPGVVEYCGHDKDGINHLKRVHIYEGIEMIAAALKLPIKIELADGHYLKTVTHQGVKFFKVAFYPNIGDEKHELV